MAVNKDVGQGGKLPESSVTTTPSTSGGGTPLIGTSANTVAFGVTPSYTGKENTADVRAWTNPNGPANADKSGKGGPSSSSPGAASVAQGSEQTCTFDIVTSDTAPEDEVRAGFAYTFMRSTTAADGVVETEEIGDYMPVRKPNTMNTISATDGDDAASTVSWTAHTIGNFGASGGASDYYDEGYDNYIRIEATPTGGGSTSS